MWQSTLPVTSGLRKLECHRSGDGGRAAAHLDLGWRVGFHGHLWRRGPGEDPAHGPGAPAVSFSKRHLKPDLRPYITLTKLEFLGNTTRSERYLRQ